MRNIEFNLESFNKEWVTFWENMTRLGLSEHYDENELRDGLQKAAGALSMDTGLGYPGALIAHINLLCMITDRLCKMVAGTFPSIDKDSLTKVCLLQHLSKVTMYVPNDVQWEIEKKGYTYKFADLPGCLKFGERSALEALNRGVKLSPVEFEAICSLDKEGEEAKNRKYVIDIMSTIVRQGNELAYAIERERFKKFNQTA